MTFYYRSFTQAVIVNEMVLRFICTKKFECADRFESVICIKVTDD